MPIGRHLPKALLMPSFASSLRQTVQSTVRNAVASVVFDEVVVQAVSRPTPRFTRVDLETIPRTHLPWTPGDKVQVMTDGGPRTYTPFDVDVAAGRYSILIFRHDDGSPGSRLGQEIQVGQHLRVLGPRRSIKLATLPGPRVLVGDETSIALAHCLRRHATTSPQTPSDVVILAVDDPDEVSATVSPLNIEIDTVVRHTVGADLTALEAAVRSVLDRNSHPSLILTGQASTIQHLKRSLRQKPPSAANTVHTAKAYWAPGKRGLD